MKRLISAKYSRIYQRRCAAERSEWKTNWSFPFTSFFDRVQKNQSQYRTDRADVVEVVETVD